MNNTKRLTVYLSWYSMHIILRRYFELVVSKHWKTIFSVKLLEILQVSS